MAIDANHLMLIKLAATPKNVQPLMMTIARDSHPSVDIDEHLMINVHFDVVQGALGAARRGHRLDLIVACIIVVAMSAGVMLAIRFLT